MKSLLAILGATLLISLRTVITQLLLAMVGPKIVEWAVVGLLKWLAKQTKSTIDDQLVEKVQEAIAGSPASPDAPDAPPAPATCPNCGHTLE